MKLTLSPQRGDESLTISRAGDVLTVNGEAYDFAPLEAGESLPAEAVGCPFIIGTVKRDAAGLLHLTVILPHPYIADPEAGAAVLFPAPLDVTEDGPIALPHYEARADEN